MFCIPLGTIFPRIRLTGVSPGYSFPSTFERGLLPVSHLISSERNEAIHIPIGDPRQ